MGKCDLTIAVLGINKSIEREGQDRYSIELPKDQQIFIEEAYKINPNTVVVLVAGSSLAINWMDEHIPAIVNAWYPGEAGGTAVAEVLFGDYNSYLGQFGLSVLEKDADNFINTLSSMLPALLQKWDISASPLYRHLAQKEDSQNLGKMMLPKIIADLEDTSDPEYDFLRSSPKF